MRYHELLETSAGSVAGVNGVLGTGDPNASIYASIPKTQPKKKKRKKKKSATVIKRKMD